MTYINRIVALVSGVLLYVACAFISTRTHFDTSEYPLLAQALIEALTIALPLFILALVWCWITLRWLARPPQATVWWLLATVLALLVYSHLNSAVSNHYSCLDFSRQRPDEWRRWGWDCSWLSSFLMGFRGFQVREAPILLALLAGIAAGAALALRSKSSTLREAHA
jgi:hypothetical protein